MNIGPRPIAVGTPDEAAIPLPPTSKESLRIFLYLLLLASDLLLLAASIALGGFIRLHALLPSHTISVLLLTLPLFVVVAINNRAYSTATLLHRRVSALRILKTLCIVMFGVIAAAFCFKASADLSRVALVLGFITAAVVLPLSRIMLVSVTRALLDGKVRSELVILDGADSSILRYSGMAMIDAAAAGLWPTSSDPAMLDRIGCIIQPYDRVVIACPPERRRLWALSLKGSGTNVEILAPELDQLGMVTTGRFRNNTTAVVSLNALGLHDRLLKRTLDLIIVLLLLPLLAPVFALAAIAIRLESPGPVLFVQRRVGQGNRLFSMYKFRTMRVQTLDADGRRSTSRHDDRITRIGALLRKTSIDELPQLLNVLKGDMSIAGPRPHAIASTAEDKLFWEVHDRYFDRHAVKPGLTGLAQVRGHRGATLTQSDLVNRLQADMEYLSGWSIWRDIAIVIRTFAVVIHRNAY
jgi:exopolysaccharide biosynthesis polyprenyl glycosylphosphotransferase